MSDVNYVLGGAPPQSPTIGLIEQQGNLLFGGVMPLWDREYIASSSGAISSQQIRFVYFTAGVTAPFTKIRSYCGGTAAGATPTLCRIGIWTVDASNNGTALVASIANDTTLWNTPTTAFLSTLQATFTPQQGVRYAAGVLIVTAAATPTYIGQSTAGGIIYQENPPLTFNLTGQSDLPNTWTFTGGSSSTRPYMELVP